MRSIVKCGMLGVILATATSCAPLAERHSADESPSESAAEAASAIASRVLETAAGELILIQEATFEAPRRAVWDAYTTAEGWQSWAAPHASVDLQIGGKILTNYAPNGTLGGPGTNTLTIVSYVPEELLTLKADVSQNWPEILKQDADRLSNVIVFHKLSDTRSKVVSYGIGYGNSPEHKKLLEFFTGANEGLLRKLKGVLEGAP